MGIEKSEFQAVESPCHVLLREIENLLKNIALIDKNIKEEREHIAHMERVRGTHLATIERHRAGIAALEVPITREMTE